MARRCIITGKGVMTGNNVSHSNRRTRRRFLPNIQNITLRSVIMGDIHLRVSTNAVRTIEHNGGIDAYLTSTPNSRLSAESLTLKKQLLKMSAAKAN